MRTRVAAPACLMMLTLMGLLTSPSCSRGLSHRDAAPADVPQIIDAGHATDTGNGEVSIACSMPGETCSVSEDCCGGPPFAICSGQTCFMTELP